MPRGGRYGRDTRAGPTLAQNREDKRLIQEYLTGRVKRYNIDRSFGFITRDDNGEDLFVHESSIWRYDLEPGTTPYFDEGQLVCFDLGIGRKGLEAINVSELSNLSTRDPRWRIHNPEPSQSNNERGSNNAPRTSAPNSSTAATARNQASASPLVSQSPQTTASSDSRNSSQERPAYLEGLSDVSSGDEMAYMMGYESPNDDEEFDPDREVSYPQFIRYYTEIKRMNRRDKEEEEKKLKEAKDAAKSEPAKASGATASASVLKESEDDTSVCQLCLQEPSVVTYQPCNHLIHCVDCAYRVKKCPKCNASVTKKILLDGKELIVDKDAKISKLLAKAKEHEEATTCQICLEAKWDIVFDCGHTACKGCTKSLKKCPFCRAKINKHTKLF